VIFVAYLIGVTGLAAFAHNDSMKQPGRIEARAEYAEGLYGQVPDDFNSQP
jgi:hypothetical protein